MSAAVLIIPGLMIVLGFLLALVGVYLWWHKYNPADQSGANLTTGLFWVEAVLFAIAAVLIGVGAGQAYHFANLLVSAR